MIKTLNNTSFKYFLKMLLSPIYNQNTCSVDVFSWVSRWSLDSFEKTYLKLFKELSQFQAKTTQIFRGFFEKLF